jgi:mannose-1-phosphate guanylyltransferase
MQAVVLVGGEGTRLRPLTLDVPKPALPLIDRPFVRFLVDWLGGHGVDEVVMACGFRADDLRDALGDEVPGGGPRIRYLSEPETLGTAGPLRLAADEGLLADRVLALNGDVLTDLDLGALIDLHEARDAVATLALYPVDDPSAYGLVRRADDGEVREFLEKPDPAEIDTDEISAGAYVLERSVIDLIPAGRAVSIEREVFPRLVGEGLYGRRLEGYWMDIGTPERYLTASWDILEGRVATGVVATRPGVWVDAGARVSVGAVVGPRAVVRSGCEVADGARVVGSVLLDGCVVGERARVEGAVLAADVSVGEGAEITEESVIGAGASIAAGAVVRDGARVQPGESVEAETVTR